MLRVYQPYRFILPVSLDPHRSENWMQQFRIWKIGCAVREANDPEIDRHKLKITCVIVWKKDVEFLISGDIPFQRRDIDVVGPC